MALDVRIPSRYRLRVKQRLAVVQYVAVRAEGRSWRDVGRALGVGVATARAALAALQMRAKNPFGFRGRI